VTPTTELMKPDGKHPAIVANQNYTKAELCVRLAEAEETLRAIRDGEVDAVVVTGEEGHEVLTLDRIGYAYRVLIESMEDGALVLTEDGTVLFSNQRFAEMVQCPVTGVIGSAFQRYLPPVDVATFKSVLQRAGAAPAKVQITLCLTDGSRLAARLTLCLLPTRGQSAPTFGLVVTDPSQDGRISRQKETDRLYAQVRDQALELERRVDDRTRQLTLANEELEAFESSVSHDLRAPLRHIVGFADVLVGDHGPELPEAVRAHIDSISRNATKMERLIEALLEFSRMGKRPISVETIDVGQMWREVLAEMQADFGDRRVEVTIGDLPSCQGDPILLRQVLVNLLSNAIKYSRTRSPSVIKITSAAAPDGSAAYSIEDNGVGFNMAYAHKLFAVFQRLHKASEFEGTGVGLTLVKRIVGRHGGRIWAESVLNDGARFFFTVGPQPTAATPPPADDAAPLPVAGAL
jgi:signal transduction histidine kinase